MATHGEASTSWLIVYKRGDGVPRLEILMLIWLKATSVQYPEARVNEDASCMFDSHKSGLVH